MTAEEEIVALKAQVRLLNSMVRALVATAPATVFNGIVEALEEPQVVDGSPDLAQAIDELRLRLAHELRGFREGLEALRGDEHP